MYPSHTLFPPYPPPPGYPYPLPSYAGYPPYFPAQHPPPAALAPAADPAQPPSTPIPPTPPALPPVPLQPSAPVEASPAAATHVELASPPSQPAVSPPLASTSKQPFIPPPPPPPLADPLALLVRSREGLSQLVAQGNIDARPSRQGPAPPPRSGACTTCRTAKAKCSQDEPKCSRCVKLQEQCEYPTFAKRGRKRMLTPNQVLLENVHRDLEAALAILSARPPLPSHLDLEGLRSVPSQSSAPSSIETAEDDEEARRLKSVIESPLAVLAHISSLKVRESTEEESGKTFLPKEKSAVGAEGYFATGLYQLRSDADATLDPVNLGILTQSDFDRLVELYFTRLHPFFLHLNPNLHTPQFLRNVSPFLSTALAYICATFEPNAQHLVPPLHDHMHRLSTRVWAEGLKSLEIVQAYLLLIHYCPIADDWGDDRRWGWLGQAVRIATEIKLHKTLNTATYDFYRDVTPLGDGAYEALSEARDWSWKLVFVTEVALCVSTGRTGSVQGLAASTLGSPLPGTLPPNDPKYNVTALIHLNRLYAKALIHSNQLQDSDSHEPELRKTFKAEWQRDMQHWRQAWPEASSLIRLIAQHDTTILASISLRFKGPVAPVLEECRLSARETAKMVLEWNDGSLNWCSNLIVVNIAYAATLLLRITAASGPIDSETRLLCVAVSSMLLRIGAMRPATRTLATLHGTRITALLNADLPKHAAAAPGSNASLASPPSNPSPISLVIDPSSPAAHGPTIGDLFLPTQTILDAHAQVGSYPAMPSLFDLPTTQSHALWDLFNERGGADRPAEQTTGANRQADAWIWKDTNQQDWLASEPGAWAW